MSINCCLAIYAHINIGFNVNIVKHFNLLLAFKIQDFYFKIYNSGSFDKTGMFCHTRSAFPHGSNWPERLVAASHTSPVIQSLLHSVASSPTDVLCQDPTARVADLNINPFFKMKHIRYGLKVTILLEKSWD